MPNDPRNTLRALGARTTRAWSEAARGLAQLPHAADLSLRDFITLLLLAPGEHTARAGIESLFGADGADDTIGALAGRGLVVEELHGVVLTQAGRAFVQALIDTRADNMVRILASVPAEQRDALLNALQTIGDAMQRADTLVKA